MNQLEPILANVVMNPSAFGGPDTFKNVIAKNKYIEKYNEYMKKNQTVAIEVYRDDNKMDEVYYHFQFPSDSNPEVIYDVVILFTSTNKDDTSETIDRYHIKIFSNSPGFAFQYAYVYNKRDLLVPALVDRFSNAELNTPPDKSNPSKAVGYDYTVFFALYHLKLHPNHLRKAFIKQYGTNISRFNPEDIPTSREVFQRRSPAQLLSFGKIKKKSKSFVEHTKNKVFSALGISTTGGKKRASSARGARKAVKASKGTRAKRSSK
jgi:hypothetical protein